MNIQPFHSLPVREGCADKLSVRIISLTANIKTARSKPHLVAYIQVRRSQVVTFAAIRLRGPVFKPRPGQKFEKEFCFFRTLAVVKACHSCRVRP